jgi:WD40 repeat protein
MAQKWHIDVDDAEGVPVTKVKSFRAHNDWVCAMAMQQEEATMPALLSASRDGSVRVWDSTECTHLGTLTGHSSSVNR